MAQQPDVLQGLVELLAGLGVIGMTAFQLAEHRVEQVGVQAHPKRPIALRKAGQRAQRIGNLRNRWCISDAQQQHGSGQQQQRAAVDCRALAQQRAHAGQRHHRGHAGTCAISASAAASPAHAAAIAAW